MYPAVKSVLDATNMLHNSKQLIEVARAKGIKVLHAPITFSDDFRELATDNLYGILANIKAGNAFLASDWGGNIIDSMAPVGQDIVVQGKRGLCAFASTNLDFILRQNGIETLILCGFLTNCCVESTMRTAYEKGYKVVTVTDCVAATSMEANQAAIGFTFPMFSIPLTSADLLTKL